MAKTSKHEQISVIGRVDQAIRTGQHGTALEIFLAVAPDELSRAMTVLYASCARRLSLPLKGLAVLHPYVRPAERHQHVATAEEKSEYAACLIRVGITEEALSLLADVPESHPQGLLYQAFAHVSRWDYRNAQEMLKRYLSITEPERYQRLIAMANLAQALAYLEDPQAKEFVDELVVETENTETMLLHCNVLMLKAHLATMAGHFRIARQSLQLAQERLSSSTSIDSFLIRKEYAILEAFQSKGLNISALRGARDEGIKRRHWESVRDCDFNLALVTTDLTLAKFLYFGTPYQFYRERIIKNFPEIDVARPFSRLLGKGKPYRLDLAFSAIGRQTHQFKLGQVPHRLLKILAEDFYRPKRPMEVFSALYPGEFYSPRYSKDRFYQACLRTRKHLVDHKIPIVIDEQDGFYKLSVQPNCAVAIKVSDHSESAPKTQAVSAETEILLQRFVKLQGRGSFTAREFAAGLKISERSARRVLQNACQFGFLNMEKRGPKTTYSFSAPAPAFSRK